MSSFNRRTARSTSRRHLGRLGDRQVLAGGRHGSLPVAPDTPQERPELGRTHSRRRRPCGCRGNQCRVTHHRSPPLSPSAPFARLRLGTSGRHASATCRPASSSLIHARGPSRALVPRSYCKRASTLCGAALACARIATPACCRICARRQRRRLGREVRVENSAARRLEVLADRRQARDRRLEAVLDGAERAAQPADGRQRRVDAADRRVRVRHGRHRRRVQRRGTERERRGRRSRCAPAVPPTVIVASRRQTDRARPSQRQSSAPAATPRRVVRALLSARPWPLAACRTACRLGDRRCCGRRPPCNVMRCRPHRTSR